MTVDPAEAHELMRFARVKYGVDLDNDSISQIIEDFNRSKTEQQADLFGPADPLALEPAVESAETVERFERPKARPNDPPTSRQADAANLPRRGTQRFRIVVELIRLRSATAEELADALRAPLNSVSTRMSELVADELVTETSRRRPTRAGSEAMVYAPTDKAVAMFPHA